MLATDTPDMADRGEMTLGGGPGMSLYSFHGRGTLNGVIPHPALVRLVEDAAEAEGLPLQRSAQVGRAHRPQLRPDGGRGVASIDLGFPMRHSHRARMLRPRDLDALAALLARDAGRAIDGTLRLERGCMASPWASTSAPSNRRACWSRTGASSPSAAAPRDAGPPPRAGPSTPRGGLVGRHRPPRRALLAQAPAAARGARRQRHRPLLPAPWTPRAAPSATASSTAWTPAPPRRSPS
jgi:hypothetical protein